MGSRMKDMRDFTGSNDTITQKPSCKALGNRFKPRTGPVHASLSGWNYIAHQYVVLIGYVDGQNFAAWASNDPHPGGAGAPGGACYVRK